MMKNITSILVLLAISIGSAGSVQAGWEKDLADELPLMGHRNWVVVVDSAYPLQTSPGIKTIYAGGDHVKVLKTVLKQVAKQKHVRPVIFADAELKYVDEKHAPGITKLRQELDAALAKSKVQKLPHEEIIKQLDEAGKTFQIVVIKTDLTLPYTSVFLRLDCGYWSAEAEDALRKAMKE